MTVTAAPVAQFTGNPTFGGSPLTAAFTNTSTGSITSYAWTFGDGGTSTAASPSHSYAAAGVLGEPQGNRTARQQHSDDDVAQPPDVEHPRGSQANGSGT